MNSRIVLFTFLALFAQQSLSLNLGKDCYCREKTIPRILGGLPLPDSQTLPWIVAIGQVKRDNETNELKWDASNAYKYPHACSGVVINQDWVLTAATCLQSTATDNPSTIGYAIGVGSELSEVYSKPPREIAFVKYHPQYKPDENTNANLAMIRLKNYLDLGEGGYIEAACLNTKYDGASKGILSTAGWGAVEPVYYNNDLKMDGEVSFSNRIKTLDVVDLSGVFEDDIRHMWAMANPRPGGIAFGDGGSPLHVTKKGQTQVVGILTGAAVSRTGSKLMMGKNRMRFSRIFGFLSFIKDVVGDDFCPGSSY